MSKLLLALFGLPGLTFLLGALAAQEQLPRLGSLMVPLIVILVLVLVNGFFVAAEFAIIGVRRTRMEQLTDEGNETAAAVLAVIESPVDQDRYIATAQLGITVASLGLGMYAEPQIAHFIEPYMARWLGVDPSAAALHSAAFLIGLSILTYLHIVVGEMVPKSLALTNAEDTVLYVIRPMQLSQAILTVPVRILNGIGTALLRLLKIPPARGEMRLHSPEELELIVTESAETGLLNEEEQEIILNIFDFSERQVGQVMTPRRKIQAIAADMPLAEIRERVADSRYSRFPVYEGDLDHIIGMMHIKDLARGELESPNGIDIRQLLRPAPAVPEVQSVATLLSAFKRRRIHMATVLDEFGGVAGIVTLEDLVEEIVGEVRDEFDVEKEPLLHLAPGAIEVAGDYLVDDLVDEVYLGDEENLPDVETVGGLIVTWLGRPPQVGDTYTYLGNIRFTVLDIDGLAVARAKVEFPVIVEEDYPSTAGQGSKEQS